MVDHDGGRSLSIRAGILGADRIDFTVEEISGDMYSTWLAIDMRCEEEGRKSEMGSCKLITTGIEMKESKLLNIM